MNIFLRSTVYVFSIMVLSLLCACQAEGMQKTFEAQAIAFGKINRINVLCDEDVWEGPLGDSIRFYYGAAYPILPQPEPIFDLRHYSLDDMRKEPIRKQLRTFVIIGDLSDAQSEMAGMIRKDIGEEKILAAEQGPGYGTSVAKNKWAKGQTLVYVYGTSFENLRENILGSYTAVAKKVNETNEKMIDATAYFRGEDKRLAEEIFSKMDVNIRIPTNYFTAISEENMIWLRRETSDVSYNILLHKVPYTDQSQLSREGIKNIRDSLGRKYISSTEPESYMRINDVDLPLIIKTISLNGNYAIEAKGIWEIVNDFMGGAFVSYLIHDPEKSELLFLDAFVHAPGKDKRDIMQELEYILHTADY